MVERSFSVDTVTPVELRKLFIYMRIITGTVFHYFYIVNNYIMTRLLENNTHFCQRVIQLYK